MLRIDIRSIAWHKAGIFKNGSPAFTVQQEQPAMEVLRQRSEERKVSSLTVVTDDPIKNWGINFYPDTAYQRCNVSLAIHLVDATLKALDQDFVMIADLTRSVEKTKVPGRSEILWKKNVWLLDIAHNEMSVTVASAWFRDIIESPE